MDWTSMNTTDHLPEMEGPDPAQVLTTLDGRAPSWEGVHELLEPVMDDPTLTLGEALDGVLRVGDRYGISPAAAVAEVRHHMDVIEVDELYEDNIFQEAVGGALFGHRLHAWEKLGEEPHEKLLNSVVPVLERTGMSVAEAVEVLRSWADGEGER